jgi:hypothetical protein
MKDIIRAIKDDEDILNEFEMAKTLKMYNILNERIEIYKDFTINLLSYIYDTYLGKEYIYKESDIKGHFTWCFKKVVEEFELEEISFIDNEKLYDYFYNFYLDQFYLSDNNRPITHFMKFWDDIFDYKKDKKKKIFDILVEVYDIFNISLENKERALELI